MKQQRPDLGGEEGSEVSTALHTEGRCAGVMDHQTFTTQEVRTLRSVVGMAVVERDVVQLWVSSAKGVTRKDILSICAAVYEKLGKTTKK